MIVSNFELLVKPIANSMAPPNVTSAFRRVVQGYFLMVSNLETNRNVKLSLGLTITSSTGNREMNSDNTVCFFDNGNTDNGQLNINRIVTSNYTKYNTQSFDLGPRETGIITILPDIADFLPNPTNPSPTPDLEIRGYTELRQLRTITGLSSLFLAVPEADILTNPETRGTFLDNQYPTQTAGDVLDFDQIAYALPTASGKLSNIVEGVPPIIIEVGPPFDLIGIQKQLMIDNPAYSKVEMIKVAKLLEDLKNDDKILELAKQLKGKNKK